MDWPLPNPRPLDLVSYSFCAAHRRCPLSVAYSRDSRFSRLNRPRPVASLGNVVHSVVERVGRNQYGGIESTEPREIVKEIWDQEAAKQYKLLAASWTPAEPPSPPDWPQYALTRTRTIREMTPKVRLDLMARPAPDAHRYEDQGLGPLPWRERELIDEVRRIHGTPDLVEMRGNEIWVVDIKTGAHQGEPSDEQVWQLLLYAHLVQLKTGILPSGAAIVVPGGGEYPITVSQVDVDTVVSEAVAIKEDFNRQEVAAVNAFRGTPSETACGYCAFRLVCPSYAEACEEDWKVLNTLTGVVTSVAGRWPSLTLEVEVQGPRWRQGQSTRIVGVSWPEEVGPGRSVALSGFKSRHDWSLVRGEWESVSYVFPKQEY